MFRLNPAALFWVQIGTKFRSKKLNANHLMYVLLFRLELMVNKVFVLFSREWNGSHTTINLIKETRFDSFQDSMIFITSVPSFLKINVFIWISARKEKLIFYFQNSLWRQWDNIDGLNKTIIYKKLFFFSKLSLSDLFLWLH